MRTRGLDTGYLSILCGRGCILQRREHLSAATLVPHVAPLVFTSLTNGPLCGGSGDCSWSEEGGQEDQV